jgi:shikimate dehydrogenase
MTPSPSTPLPDRYAVLGHPVAHSQSPFIHAEFALQTGQFIRYDRIESPLDQFEPTVRRFMTSGDAAAGLGRAGGCNITLPFKFQVIPMAKRVTPRAALAQAANTLRFDADGWLADNTDGVGLMRDLQGSAGITLAGRRVLLIGAGGAAAGVLGPLIETRPAQITVANRTTAKAASLVQRHLALASEGGVTLAATGLADCGEGFDVVINSSASSLSGGPIPVAAAVLGAQAWAVDLMYGAAARPFLDWAAQHGARGRDGLGMLVEQAAESFQVWRGVLPQTAPVLAALRSRLQSPSP